MMTTIRQFFAMFTALFSAGTYGATALENVAKATCSASELYLVEQQATLNAKRKELALLTQD